jgi:hypothetical protein
MVQHRFSLLPFERETAPQIQIEGTVSRQDCQLDLSYSVSDPSAILLLPSWREHPVRRDELWQSTCFEFFLGIPDMPSYWEFNLSPAGDWNIYHFQDYRQGMVPETAIATLPFQVHRYPTVMHLELSCNLAQLVTRETSLQLSITAVLQTQKGAISYWALTHPAPDADFHHRSSFILTL